MAAVDQGRGLYNASAVTRGVCVPVEHAPKAAVHGVAADVRQKMFCHAQRTARVYRFLLHGMYYSAS